MNGIFLENAAIYPPNADYFNFFYSGLANFSSVLKAPIFGSRPHFLGADPQVQQMISGLSPNQQAHDSWLKVEPITGSTLAGVIRLQLNLIYTTGYNGTAAASLVVMPVFWGEKGANLTSVLAKKFKGKVYKAESAVTGWFWSNIALACAGGLLLIACIAFFIYYLLVLREKSAYDYQHMKEFQL